MHPLAANPLPPWDGQVGGVDRDGTDDADYAGERHDTLTTMPLGTSLPAGGRTACQWSGYGIGPLL